MTPFDVCTSCVADYSYAFKKGCKDLTEISQFIERFQICGHIKAKTKDNESKCARFKTDFYNRQL